MRAHGHMTRACGHRAHRLLGEQRRAAALAQRLQQALRIHDDPVATDTRARVMRHEAERLGRRGARDLDRVDLLQAAGIRHLERERDVHRPERALVELDHLGRLR